MTTLPASPDWYPDRLLRAVLVWTGLIGIVFWLPIVRGIMDGGSYEWALGRFRGQGTAGDLWFPVLGAGIVLTSLYLGWRGARPGFGPFLLLFHVPLTAASIYSVLTNPGDYRFRGDTLGVEVSLAFVAPLLFAGFTALSVYWLALHRNSPRVTALAWTKTSRVLLGTIVALFPLQYFLLRAPNGSTDGAGVILTIAQWVLINVAMRPARPSKEPAPQRTPAR